MVIDLNQGWSDASKKVSAIKTVNELKQTEKELKKNTANSTKELTNKTKKRLSDAKSSKKENIKQIKSEQKNQLELLLDLFKESLPGAGGPSLALITKIFLEASNQTKEKIKETLIDEIVSTIGCSEEQSYETTVGQPFYIKVNQIDLFDQLKTSPDDEIGKVFYEDNQTSNGSVPYSMNRELYKRLQTPNQSFSQDTNAGNGQNYISLSQSQIFDIEYVQNYTDSNNVLVTGDFYKVTLNSQANNRTSVSDFLRDYYGSIDILSFDVLSANLKSSLTGSFDAGLGLSQEQLKSKNDFFAIIKRIMGICSDPSKKIDVSGTAKLSDLDDIDDSFFEPTPQEEMISDNNTNNVLNKVVEFEDCGNIQLPININSDLISQNEIVKEKNDSKKIELFEKYINDTSKDPNWQKISQKFGFSLPGLDLNIKSSLQTSLITKMPSVVFKSVLTPKVLLGFFIMIKAIKNELSNKIDSLFDTIQGFLKTFKKFVVNFVRKIMSLFVETLFKVVKKNIKLLVETILLEIIRESKIKKLRMYSTIIYILLQASQALVDFRNCRSVIDEILKLLNLRSNNVNLGIPQFILASSSLLGGESDTRSMSNIIENLQTAGLPTGPAPDGGPNLMNIAMLSMVQGQSKEKAEFGVTEVFNRPTPITPAGFTLPSKGVGKSY